MRRWAGVALMLGAAFGACGGDGGGDEGGAAGPRTTTTAPATSTTALRDEVPAVDWLDPDLSIDVGGGFTIAHCPGDAPVHCITKEGAAAGLIELASFPITSLEAVQSALPRGERAALEAHVSDFLVSFREDRAEGCGAAYTVTPEPIRFLTGVDGVLAAYGFSGSAGGASPTERTIQWAGLEGDHLVLLTVSAFDPGSCVSNEGEATVADLASLEPFLRPIVEGNPLPDEVGPPGGL